MVKDIDVTKCDLYKDVVFADENPYADLPCDSIVEKELPEGFRGIPVTLLRTKVCSSYMCHCKDKSDCYFKRTERFKQQLKKLLRESSQINVSDYFQTATNDYGEVQAIMTGSDKELMNRIIDQNNNIKKLMDIYEEEGNC